MLLLSESRDVWIEGDIFSLLAPLLNGKRSVRQIVDASGASVADALTSLVLLDHAGWLVPGDIEPASPVVDEDALIAAESALLDSRRLGPSHSRKPVWISVELRPDQSDALESALGWLRQGTVSIDDLGDSPVIVVTNDDLHPEVAALAERQIANGRSWLPVQPFGRRPWIGPVVSPEAACWGCLRERLRANRAIETCLDLAPPRPWSHESVAWMLSFALRRTPRPGDAARSIFLDHRVVVDFDHSRLTAHAVARSSNCRHHCRHLGSPREATAERRASAVELTSRPRVRGVDGGHRVESAESTLRRLGPFVDPVTGPVRSLERIQSDEDSLSVFVAAAAYPGNVSDWTRLRRRLRSRCAGKGRSDVQARVSAVAEAMERYAGFQRPDDQVRVASLRELGDLAIDPRSCLLFSEQQYEERDAWNARESQSNWIPQPFDDDEPIEWTPLWSLRDDTERYLPTAWCYYDPLAGPSPYCRADSNGAAAGNCMEEAILQGFLEVVERDAGTLWWYSRARRPPVEWPEHDACWTRAVRSQLERLDRDAWLLDLTADLGVPVVVAVSRRRNRSDDDLLLGFGAHLDPRLAAERAVAELCQFLVTDASRTGKEQRIFHHDADVLDWLEPDDSAPRSLPHPAPTDPDLLVEVRHCVDLAAAHGLDTLVLRQTRDETPLDVVKVVVPHLRPWWPRFAPGRLFDVPVQLGWLESPLDEKELNPIHLLI